MQNTLEIVNVATLIKAASNNRFEVAHSERCACFFCGQTFAPEQVTEWTDKDMTALCPSCKMDSVLPDYNTPIDAETIAELNRYAF